MDAAQKLIHKLEVAGGMRWFRWGFLILGVALLIVGYNLRGFRNFSTQEAMDSAQVARNVARGKGFTTEFVRPLSMYLLKQREQDLHGVQATGLGSDATRLKSSHPDLANPPVYPVLLAGLMKVLPFNYDIKTAKGFWNPDGRFARYQPDFLIGAFNQLLFFAVVVLVFFVARRLFDKSVAWFAAVLTLGTDLFWRFSLSGLSTMLLLLIFMGLAWCLILLEAETREPKHGAAGLWLLALGAGALVGIGALTRYSFGWLILPALLFIFLVSGSARVRLTLAALAVFLALLTPWVIRNYSLCGAPFGTAGFSAVQSSVLFPENRLTCNLEPDLTRPGTRVLLYKLAGNASTILTQDLPTFAGGWLTALGLVGLVLSFNTPAASRLRNFLLACLGLLIVVQALGRTQLSEDSPTLNSENLLVILAPLVLIYGVHLFYLLLSQFEFVLREVRLVVLSLFAVAACVPLLLTIWLNSTPIAWPPYFPPLIQSAAGWTREDELTVSDIPWAMAWYGDRQCAWINKSTDFVTVNDYQKPIQALWLTPVTLNGKFVAQWLSNGEPTWGNLVLQTLPSMAQVRQFWPDKPCPVNLGVSQTAGSTALFPLHNWQAGWPQFYLLTAREKALKSL